MNPTNPSPDPDRRPGVLLSSDFDPSICQFQIMVDGCDLTNYVTAVDLKTGMIRVLVPTSSDLTKSPIDFSETPEWVKPTQILFAVQITPSADTREFEHLTETRLRAKALIDLIKSKLGK